MKFYKKELVSNPLSLPDGRRVRFEQIGASDTGVLATEDPGLITELDKAAARHVGGVVEITSEQYQELKKNPPVERSQIRSLSSQSIRQLLNRPRPGAAPAAAAIKHEPSAPMEVPKGLATVSSRRKLEELQKAGAEKAASPPSPATKPAAPKAVPPKPVTAKPSPPPPAPTA